MATRTITLTVPTMTNYSFPNNGQMQLTALDGQTYKPGASIVGGGMAWPSVSNGTTTMTLKTMTGLTVQKGWTVSLGGHRSLTFTYTYN